MFQCVFAMKMHLYLLTFWLLLTFTLFLFFLDKRSSDLNQPSLLPVDSELFDCANVLILFVLFCDEVRFGIGLAFGVDSLRRLAISGT